MIAISDITVLITQNEDCPVVKNLNNVIIKQNLFDT